MFLESILFFKNWKIQKQCCPVLATQSRVSQVTCHSRELADQFRRLVREWKVQSWGVHRDFRGSTRDSLVSETSSRGKHLEIFSKLLAWSVLAGVSSDYLATYLSHEKRVFCTMRAVFKIFFSFLSNFLWLFIVFSIWNFSNTLCYPLPTPLLLHFFSKSSRKGMGLLFLTSYFMVWVLFSCLLCWHCIL